jgi:hypothetical protein
MNLKRTKGEMEEEKGERNWGRGRERRRRRKKENAKNTLKMSLKTFCS